MNATTKMSRLSPWATTMIRLDHGHVMATFHRYRADAAPDKKLAIANTICDALEIHAKLEEEIFYPAMRRFDSDVVDKSYPEHNEMKRLIARLRELQPDDGAFDATFLELMRDVIRHVADEETILLPDAERSLGGDELSELGAQMTRRRFELAGPRAGEIAVNAVRTFPAMTLAVSGAIAVGAFFAGRALVRSSEAAALPAPPMRRAGTPKRLRAMTERITAAVTR